MLLVQTNHVVTPKQKSHNGPCKVPFSLQWPSMAHLLDPLIDRCPHTLELKLSLGHLLAIDSIFVDIGGDLSAFFMRFHLVALEIVFVGGFLITLGGCHHLDGLVQQTSSKHLDLRL
jgi:hypothetical protein